MVRAVARWAVAAGVLATVAVAGRAGALPEPAGAVTDAARVLAPESVEAISRTLADVEAQTTAEIAVVTVPSLDGLTIEQYAEQLFRRWGIGQKGQDNGVLILVAPADRRVRIEVGYGLEPILPDGLAGEIIREQALPAFREGQMDAGIRATVARVAAIVRAQQIVPAGERRRLDGDGWILPWLTTVFFGMFVAGGAAAVGAGLRVRAVAPILFGLAFGGLPLLIALLPFNGVNLWVIGLVAGAAGVAAWWWADDTSWRAALRSGSKRHGRGADRGGWVMGSTGRSGRGGSSESSGGFSGGSSGGGGASGSW